MSNVYYNAPYLDQGEHSILDHTGIPGVGGGSGGFIDLFQSINDQTQASLPEGSSIAIKWDPNLVPGFGREQGTALSWGGGDPTKVVVVTTGYYSIYGTIAVQAGAETFTPNAGISINGSPIQLYSRNGLEVTTTNANINTVDTFVIKLSLTAGDYIELTAGQVGNTTADNVLALAQLTVTRDG